MDLERLLPHRRSWGGSSSSLMGGGEKLDLIFREGKAYFAPAAPSQKISHVRRWEQAFRVYAAVYSQANPARAAEIWQYVHVINLAAASYVWENVAYYDVTFRHLMAQNPARSWAKIYNQMWNLAMREPLPQKHSNFQSFGGKGNNNGGSGNNGQRRKKPKYCWAYNRGQTCKDGNSCKYIHKCSYCDAGDHIKQSFPKQTTPAK